MAVTTGMMDSWKCPNYAGELFTADEKKTPFLTMAGGLSGGKTTNYAEFVIGQTYDYPTVSQPSITETASVTAPQATFIARNGQKTNVCQIFHETISTTYVQQSSTGKMSGLELFGQKANPANEFDWQIGQRLKKIARDVEHTFLNGSFNKATAANEANKTRGILELCSTGTTIAAAGADLNLTILSNLYREMVEAGAYLDNMVMFVPAYQKQVLTSLYEKQLGYNARAPRNVGGMNINWIENDFFQFGIVYEPFLPNDTILLADMAHVSPVFQPVPGKGVLFREQLAKTGAAESCQIFGQIGLDHGLDFLHATITGLKTPTA